MKDVKVFLADGFEEIEGLTVVDLLRRAGAAVDTVSVTGCSVISGAHGIKVEADILFEEADFSGTDMLVLPGGMPGTVHLQEHPGQGKIYCGNLCGAEYSGRTWISERTQGMFLPLKRKGTDRCGSGTDTCGSGWKHHNEPWNGYCDTIFPGIDFLTVRG